MNNLNLHPLQQLALGIAVAVLVSLFLVYQFLLVPMRDECNELIFANTTAQQEVDKMAWTSNDAMIQRIAQQTQRQFNASRNNKNNNLSVASLLLNRITEENLQETFTQGIKKGAQLNARFRDEFKEFRDLLSAGKMPLPCKTYFEMNNEILDDSNNQQKAWQLLMKLWTAEEAYKILRDLKFSFVKTKNEPHIDDRKKAIFYYEEDPDKPFLVAFPIAFQVTGTIEQFNQLIQQLNKSEKFLPISHFSAELLPENNKISRQWKATIEFSGLLPIELKNDEWTVPFPVKRSPKSTAN